MTVVAGTDVKLVRQRLSGAARHDIEDLLAWSDEHFGQAAR